MSRRSSLSFAETCWWRPPGAAGAVSATTGADSIAAAAAVLAALLSLAHALLAQPLGPTLPAPELHGVLAWALTLSGTALLLPRCRAGRGLAAAALVLVALQHWHALPLAPGESGTVPLGLPAGTLLVPALGLLALLLWPWPDRLRPLAAVALQLALAVLWALCAAALCLLLPGPLLLDGLPLSPGLSWPTLAVLAAAGLAVSLRLLRSPALQDFYAEREDRRIFAISVGMLFASAALAVTLVVALLTVETVRTLQPLLRRGAHAQAQALDLVLAQAARAGSAAADLVDAPGRDAPPERLALALRRLAPLGPAGLELRLADGTRWVEGRLHDGGGTLPGADAQAPALSFDDGLVVHLVRPLAHQPGAQLLIQLRPTQPQARLAPLDPVGAAAEVMLCTPEGAGARCLSGSRPEGQLMPLPPRPGGEPWPVQRAWRGQDGVELLRDPRGAAVAVAHAPVGRQGLGLVQRLPLAPLFQRLAEAVLPLLAAMGGVVAAGAWLLYRRSFPPLRALRDAKAQLQATLEHLPRGVLTVDPQGRVRSSNVQAQQLCGLTAAQLQGRLVGALLSAGPAGAPWPLVVGSGEALLHLADGGTVPVEVLVERYDVEGEQRWLLILRDLRRELARRAELLRWESIFVHAGWGVAATGPQGRAWRLVNPAFARMHGRSAEQLVGQPVEDLVAPAARAALQLQRDRVRAEGHVRFESWHCRADGEAFPVVVDVTRVQEPDGAHYAIVNVQDITAQRAAQEAVRRSEALLQLVLKSLPVGVWIADREGRIVATNPAVERLWGGVPPIRDGRPVGTRTRRVADGRPVGPDDYPMLQAIRSGRPRYDELIEVERPDGSRRTLLSAAVPLVGADGAIEGAIAVNEDLTVLRRAEAAGRAARDVFENLFQSAAVGLAVWDADGRFVRVNRALCELLGCDETTLLASSLREVDDPAHLAEDLAACARLRAGGVAKLEVERCWRRCDGRPQWVLMTVSLLRLPDADQPQFVAQLLDIDRSRRFQLALQASEARLQDAHRIARLADWQYDPQREAITLSGHGWRMLGEPMDGTATVPLAQWLQQVHDDDRDALRQALARSLNDGEPLAADWRARATGGPAKVFHLQGERVQDDGAPRLVGALQDITERKQIETELLRSRKRLRELSASEESRIEQERRHIAREVHDELGQALTALKMELSLLQRHAGGDAVATARVERMQRMADDTLLVVRHIASNLRPAALDFGLVAAIEWLAEDFGLRWELPCMVQVEGQEVELDDGRATAVFRIVQESLTNIARHARAQRVTIDLRCDSTRLQLSVHDDGIGFEPGIAQERGDHFGLLGMRERALKIGAQWRIDSRPGAGTTVRLELALDDP